MGWEQGTPLNFGQSSKCQRDKADSGLDTVEDASVGKCFHPHPVTVASAQDLTSWPG